MKNKLQPVRGTRDVWGQEIEYFSHVINTAKQIANRYNFGELITPIFENSEVFHRSIGETTDIISKETYTFLDRDKDSLTLRPEFTAGVVRAFISNGLTQTLPAKFFSAGPIFRHERPQKCRYRQFNQINFEFIGSKEYRADVELIMAGCDLLKALKLYDNITLEINTIGDLESRVNYREKLVAYLSKYKEELSDVSKERLEKNPMRILDSKDENDRRIIKDAPSIDSCLTDEAKAFFENVKNGLNDLGVKFKVNPKLVRGLDYYCHTVFEFITTELGSQGTVLAGGRYDGLISLMGGPATPAVGFAAGVERLAELMLQNKTELPKSKVIALIPIGQKAEDHAMSLAHALRAQGCAIEYNFTSDISKRMKHANRISASHTLIFGDDELAQNVYKLKDMNSGAELTHDFAKLCAYLKVL